MFLHSGTSAASGRLALKVLVDATAPVLVVIGRGSV